MKIDLTTPVTLLPMVAELRYAGSQVSESVPCPIDMSTDEFLKQIKAAMIARQGREESENASK